MKDCPRCASVQAWVLGDGRFKCRACGRRYSWRSVWDSVRLSESAKHALLDAFVRGVPAAKCMAELACTDSRERFYRVIRACCARHERLTRDGLDIVHCQATAIGSRSTMRGWSTSHRVVIVGIAERPGRVQICAPPGNIAAVLDLLRARTAVGGVVQVSATLAYACLQMQGDYVCVPPTTRAPLASQSAQEFWHHARMHLQSFRKIPLKFFQLYLAETCLRFNHRGQDLRALLKNSMSSTASGELKQLLRGEIAKDIYQRNVVHQSATGRAVEIASAEV
jgi:transposase